MTSTMWNGVGGWLNLLRVPPSGTWERRSADLYAVAEDWLTSAPDATRDEGLDLLVRRYLGGFGPASRKDIASWAGDIRDDARARARADAVARFRDEHGGELLDLPRRRSQPPTPGARPVPPDVGCPLLVHARRTRILPERFRPMLFDTKTPHSFPSFLVDGQVGGYVEASRRTRRRVAVRAVAASRPAGRRRRGAAARGLAGVTLRSRGVRRSARRPPAA